ncbi:MAG: hypothetical protein M1818_001174 [Claussenomyces sp. TS43310]|nr:MAG: hypothetical protein M1818_001174 [Claussenomyces sp. TS43310]
MPLLTHTGKPRVILGLMTFGPAGHPLTRIGSLDEFNTALDHFQAAGYNEVDTARVYIEGQQEAFTRQAHWKERGLTLATKVYPSPPGNHKPEVITKLFETSLKELGTDCVDIFYLHAAILSLEERNRGKFVQLGLSNFTAFEVAEVVMHCKYNNWVRPTIYQGMYNAITRSLAAEVIPACRRYGLDVVTYNPIAGGLFSGKYKAKEDDPKEGRFNDSTRQGQMYRERYFRDSTFEALSIIQPVVEKHGLTLVETALRWMVHHSDLKVTDGNDGILIGVGSIEHLDQNLKDFEKGPLPEEVVQALDQAWLVCKPQTPNYYHLDLK